MKVWSPLLAPTRSSRNAGFTSLEAMISILLFMSLFGVLGTTTTSVNLQLREATRTTQTGETARIALDKIVSELQTSARAAITPVGTEPATSVAYQVVEGWTAGAPTLSAEKTLSFTGSQLQLDGVLLFDGLSTVEFSRSGNLVTVRVAAQQPLDEQTVITTQWVAHVAN